MTGHGAKTWTGDEKSLVEVHRKNAKIMDILRISVFWGLSGKLPGQVGNRKC
jgi:hypothetical protein